MDTHCRRIVQTLGLFVVLVYSSCSGPERTHDTRAQITTIGEAVLNYRKCFGALPPAAILDSDEHPIHSSRVLILPFVEANAFTEEYDLSTAWNAPSNRDLVSGERHFPDEKFPYPAQVRSVYQRKPSRNPTTNHETSYLMVLGDGTTIEPAETLHPPVGHRGWKAIVAEQEGSLFIIEVKTSGVHWMEPRDILLSGSTGSMLPIDSILDNNVVASVAVSSSVVYHDRQATLQIIAARKANLATAR